MKIINNDDKIIVFLNNREYSKINNNEIEKYFKSLILKIEDKLDIEYYNGLSAYIDYNYGMILEFKINDSDFFFDSDMKINIFKNNYFLYNIDFNFIDKNVLKYCTIYKLNEKIYLKINKKINRKLFYKILEYSDIIYGEKAIKIEKISKKVNYETTSSSISRKT